MTYEETKSLLKLFFDTYPNVKISNPEQMVSTWHFVLKDYDLESIRNAVRLHITESKFFPTPADITSRIMRGNMLYSEVNYPQIEASTDSYMEDQLEWYLSEFQEGGSLGYDVEPEFTKGQCVPGTGLLDVTDPRKLGLNAYKPLSDWANIIGDKKGID